MQLISLVLGLFCKLGGSLLILLTDFVELLHVLEEVWASLEGDEKLGLLRVSAVVGGLHSDGLGSDLLEGGIVVSTQNRQVSLSLIDRQSI